MYVFLSSFFLACLFSCFLSTYLPTYLPTTHYMLSLPFLQPLNVFPFCFLVSNSHPASVDGNPRCPTFLPFL